MKTIKTWLATIAVLLCSISASAHNFEVDGIYYNILSEEDKTVAVIHANDYHSAVYSGSVSIPNSVTYNSVIYSVTSIGDYAFYNCSGLTSITIPNSVTSIGYRAFYSCEGLTSIAIPNSVSSIGDYAFYYCEGLASITIPNSVTSIGKETFYNCSGLTSIVVEEGNSVYDSRNNCNAIIETSTNTLLTGCKNTIIPNSVTSIGDKAFEFCSGLTSITLPNSVTSIGSSAFSNCSGLTSITLPNSVTSIGYNAFAGCSGLTSVTIPNSVTSIGNYAFQYCTHLTSITIPNSVTSIGDNAFYYCSGLTSITIPNSVTSIGKETFYYCSALTSITIPNSVTSIGNKAFYNCSGLTSITIPNSVTSIGDYAFYNCSGLMSITIPNSVTIISSAAFSGCSGLTSITLPNSVTSIRSSAFSSCSGLTSITIPNSVTFIGSHAFNNCPKLLNVYCYAENVPSTVSYVFDNSYQEYATLHVPATALESYKSTSPWSSFGNIVALTPSEVALEDGVEYENNTEAENVPQITYTRTLPNLQWNALFVPFEIPVSELADDYDVAYINDIHSYDKDLDGEIDQMEMEVIYIKEETLHANHPYLIRAKSNEAKSMNIVVTDATLYSSAKADRTSITCSSAYNDFEVIGTYEKMTALELDGCYAINTSGAWSPIASGASLNPFRLYMTITSRNGSPVKVSQSAMSRINIRVQGEDTETGIGEIVNEDAKAEIYDMTGRRLQNAHKGIYIINGKKVIK